MRYKYEIRIPFFFCISADQHFLFRFEIKWILNLSIILFCHKFLDLIKSYSRDLFRLRYLNIQDLQLSCILFFKQGHRILKKSGLHCHDIFKSVDISHFKIQAGVFVEVSLGIMLFCTEYRSSFKYTVKNSHHHLLIKLRALLEDRRSVEIFQPEEVCSSLRTFRTDLRSMDLCKSFLIKEIPEPSYDSFLNPEFCTLSDISQRNWSVI